MNHDIQNRIPVVDIFAGPGGLAEGFSILQTAGKNAFRICLSVEKDPYAHSTLLLRSFFRQFPRNQVPDEYYAYLRKEITRDELFEIYQPQADEAKNEAWHAELGSVDFPVEDVDERIEKALGKSEKWVLMGGPPCQAYSTAGRSRNKGIEGYVPEEDGRHFLYREYLRIISRHWPTVFVMENVKGLLSAKVNGSKIFDHILGDLRDPRSAIEKTSPAAGNSGFNYRIYSFTKPGSFPFDSNKSGFCSADYLIKSEDYGIPQARHRVILFGVREDAGDVIPELLTLQNHVNAGSVMEGLPELRSGLSREVDTHKNWEHRIREMIDRKFIDSVSEEHEINVWNSIATALDRLHISDKHDRGGEFVPFTAGCGYRKDWYLDSRLKGVCNHSTKAHMQSDLHRYLFAACFTNVHGRSPTLPDFPEKLWPEHKNAHKSGRSGNFTDRFRVQLPSKPSTTVMSHISKDGHYYIHYDPSQCRSLTVREAARLQTFPDNYFFEGPRTQQYTQVGNAVPPLLALQIASIVNRLLLRI